MSRIDSNPRPSPRSRVHARTSEARLVAAAYAGESTIEQGSQDQRDTRPRRPDRQKSQRRRGQIWDPVPTESEFEEFTADTLLGSHFVRTYDRPAPSPRHDMGLFVAIRDRTREVGIAGLSARGKLGSPRPSDAGSWDHLPWRPEATWDVRPRRGIGRGKVGSPNRTAGCESVGLQGCFVARPSYV